MTRQGVLVISHGSRDPAWVKLVDEAVSALALPAQIPVESAFLELVEGRLIQDGIDRLEASGVTEIAVIPLFISSGSTHVHEISWAFGVIDEPAIETDLTPFRCQSRVLFGKPIDDDPLIACILQEHAASLSRDPKREVLLLIGHGSDMDGFYERWQQGMTQLADRLKQALGFAAAETAMLLPDQIGSKLRLLDRQFPGYEVVVVPLFLSEGYFTRTVIPDRLRSHSSPRYRYDGKALLPHPLITEWMRRQVGHILQKRSVFPS